MFFAALTASTYILERDLMVNVLHVERNFGRCPAMKSSKKESFALENAGLNRIFARRVSPLLDTDLLTTNGTGEGA